MSGQWQPDPEGRYEYRWWDGQRWTDQIFHQGRPARRRWVGAPPAGNSPGPSVASGPRESQPQSQSQPQFQAQVATPGHAQVSGDGFAGISGDLVDGRFSEKKPSRLRIRIRRCCASVWENPSWLGRVRWSPIRATWSSRSRAAGLAVHQEGADRRGFAPMRCQGQGDVFSRSGPSTSTCSNSKEPVYPSAERTCWPSPRAWSGTSSGYEVAQYRYRRSVQHHFAGTGWVALTTDGPPVVLNAAEAPTFADTNAVVAWSSNLQTQLKTSFTAGALIGRGSRGDSGVVLRQRLRYRAALRGHQRSAAVRHSDFYPRPDDGGAVQWKSEMASPEAMCEMVMNNRLRQGAITGSGPAPTSISDRKYAAWSTSIGPRSTRGRRGAMRWVGRGVP